VLSATLFVYFLVLHLVGVTNLQGLRSAQLMLKFFVQVKNFEAILFYSKYLMSERNCAKGITHYAVGLLCANGFLMVTGFYFLGRLYFYILDH
jgi:hypothetical protein